MEKYFLPDIEDIRVGYECEIFEREIWKSVVVDTGFGGFDDSFEIAKYHIERKELRTLHLTKEQIEVEGWGLKDSIEYSKMYDDLDGNIDGNRWYRFNKEKWEIRWWGNPDYIEIYKTYLVGVFLPTDGHKKLEHDCIYQGACPSINELRFVQKLLKIKL